MGQNHVYLFSIQATAQHYEFSYRYTNDNLLIKVFTRNFT